MSASELPDAPLTVAAVAARLGVVASTLRTWDRRYGLGPSCHEAGSHRRYTPADVARLERMRALTVQGVAPSDAARIAMAEAAADAPVQDTRAGARRRRALNVVGESDVVCDPLTLAAAALEPDPARVERIISFAIGRLGLVPAWVGVIRPAARILREKTRADRPGVEPEVTITAGLCDVISRMDLPPISDDAPAIGLISGPHGIMHGQVIAAELARRGADVYMLRGAHTSDGDDVISMIDRHRVRAVVAVGQVPALKAIMTSVSEQEGCTGFVVGAYAAGIWLPHIHQVRTVPAVVEEMSELLGL
ncbi:MAG: MerR family transcriptional regulator [Bowdeniella nasicola]|nr:MerR family transcriptional regulator [Bowdeniella nasicola]